MTPKPKTQESPPTPRKSRSSTSKAASPSKSRSPKKSELKAKWDEWVEGHIWRPKEGTVFRHPGNTITINKEAALRLDNVRPRLKPRHLEVLPHESTLGKDGWPMYLYSEDAVRGIIRARAKICGYIVPVPIRRLNTPRGPPVLAEVVEPHIDHSYARLESDPQNIIWEGQHVSSKRPILVRDACVLYDVNPVILKDLTAKSRWLDVKTVAMRAAKAHGGVEAHNQSIAEKRRAAVKALEGDYKATCYTITGEPLPWERLSKNLRDVIPRGYNDGPEGSNEERARTVQQYWPIQVAFTEPDEDCRYGRYFEENGRSLRRDEYDSD
ncbi:hypothetical protein V5O48_015135 [Marasmius crinis-equi]|uniref:Uncharacterized protein n=1 Tax=Marasmius crinis-equi TaxID=585013 RepID=A0ABR3EVD7_9AGAR